MPIFDISGQKLSTVEQKKVALEKDLKMLIESNLDTVFNCRFVASEFLTGTQHPDRIDSLALPEEANPVIIEYKKIESLELINDSLFYLRWIQDHKGDFEIAVQMRLASKRKDIRKLTATIREFIFALDESIEEVPKKFYVAYKISQNIVCIEVKDKNIKRFLKLKLSDIPRGTPNYREVTSIGHYGAGDVECTESSGFRFQPAREFIAMAYYKDGD